jgi:hypothetical protein
MNKKFLICFFCLFALADFEHPEKLGKLNEILNPFMIRVDSDNAYISDQYYVFFYSLKDLKLLSKVGGKGEGPANFLVYPKIRVMKDSIIAYSAGRITFFSRSGESLGDKKISRIFFLLDYTKGNFVMPVTQVAAGKEKVHLTQYTVFDSDFNVIKVIHSIKIAVANSQRKVKKFLISPLTTFQCYDDKIYLVDGQNGFQIKVFDYQGKFLKQIQREYEKIEIPESVKKEKYKKYINTPAIKKRLRIFKEMYEPTFPEHFPPIQDFRISESKMYIKTYKTSGGKAEFIILDLNGKLLGKTFLPDIQSSLFDIVGNRFYFLKEDENEDYWELHSTKIQ